MLEETLGKRKHVIDYCIAQQIPDDVIDGLLRTTWELTPSQNNFMPYSIFVLGPEHKKEKRVVYENVIFNQERINSLNPLPLVDDDYINLTSLLSCSHLLIFTLRLETQPNAHQKRQIEKGFYFEAVDEQSLESLTNTASLEVGMFTNTLSALCLEKGIHTSFLRTFPKDLECWKPLPFIKRNPLLLFTIGKGKAYLRDRAKSEGWHHEDHKPDFDRIVQKIKSEEGLQV